MRGRGGGKKRGTFQPKRAGLGLPGKRRVVLGYNQNEPPQRSNLTARFGPSAQAEIQAFQALKLQKRGGGRGRGGPGSHKNLYTVEKNLVGAGRSSQNEPHDDDDNGDDDVVLVDEEGNDQAQQQNDDLRSVLNERR